MKKAVLVSRPFYGYALQFTPNQGHDGQPSRQGLTKARVTRPACPLFAFRNFKDLHARPKQIQSDHGAEDSEIVQINIQHLRYAKWFDSAQPQESLTSRARRAVSGLKCSELACSPRGTLRKAAKRRGVDETIGHTLDRHMGDLSWCMFLRWAL